MEKIRKLFGEYEMTWKRLIIFSVICGVYSAAVLLIPGVKESALREIGVGYECWFLLAIFVVSNCKSAKEAAVKCFVFFLISQPIIYLVQIPFVQRNLLADYYKPWFIKTFFTLPGGFIAYQIKRNDLLGTLVLAVAGASVGLYGVLFFISNLNPLRISYPIYGIFLLACAALLGVIFCKKKKNLIIYLVLVIVISFGFGIYYFQNRLQPKDYEMTLSDEDWYLSSCRFSDLNADIEDDVLKITYYNNKASGELTLVNKNDKEVRYSIRVENGEIVLEELK